MSCFTSVTSGAQCSLVGSTTGGLIGNFFCNSYSGRGGAGRGAGRGGSAKHNSHRGGRRRRRQLRHHPPSPCVHVGVRHRTSMCIGQCGLTSSISLEAQMMYCPDTYRSRPSHVKVEMMSSPRIDVLRLRGGGGERRVKQKQKVCEVGRPKGNCYAHTRASTTPIHTSAAHGLTTTPIHTSAAHGLLSHS